MNDSTLDEILKTLEDMGVEQSDVLRALRRRAVHWINVGGGDRKTEMIRDLLTRMIRFCEDDELPAFWYYMENVDNRKEAVVAVEPAEKQMEVKLTLPTHTARLGVQYQDGDVVVVFDRPSDESTDADGQLRITEDGTEVSGFETYKQMLLP